MRVSAVTAAQAKLSSDNQKKDSFCRQTKKIRSRMSRLDNWLLLPLCILAHLGNWNLWHLQVQRAAEQREVVCIYSFKSDAVRAEIKQVREAVCAEHYSKTETCKERTRNRMQFKCQAVNPGLR